MLTKIVNGVEEVMSDAEEAEIRADWVVKPLSNAEIKADILATIDALETKDKVGRRYREAYLLQCVAEATKQGYTEAQAYTLNAGYRGAKDLDNQIKALRASIPK